jgi:hypothetical protein
MSPLTVAMMTFTFFNTVVALPATVKDGSVSIVKPDQILPVEADMDFAEESLIGFQRTMTLKQVVVSEQADDVFMSEEWNNGALLGLQRSMNLHLLSALENKIAHVKDSEDDLLDDFGVSVLGFQRGAILHEKCHGSDDSSLFGIQPDDSSLLGLQRSVTVHKPKVMTRAHGGSTRTTIKVANIRPPVMRSMRCDGKTIASARS